MGDEIEKREDTLFKHVAELIELSRQHVKKAVDTTMVYTYYGIGKYIVEDELQDKDRAEYGRKVIENLSVKLTEKFGKGWSVATLKNCRQFYSVFRIGSATQSQSKASKGEKICNADPIPNFALSWNHYQVLMRIANPEERHFYELEAKQQGWD